MIEFLRHVEGLGFREACRRLGLERNAEYRKLPEKHRRPAPESFQGLERLKADTANKQAMAERNRLKLERELGRLISRDDHETELAARAAFFRREIETFGPRLAPRLIALVGGDDGRLEALTKFWAEETEIWMDAWAGDRAFIVPQGTAEESESPAGSTEQAEDIDEPEDEDDEFPV